MFNNTFKGKKVLVTGHTGFKGSWLTTWLKLCGAEIYGYSKDIPTNPSMFKELGLEDRINNKFADIRNEDEFEKYLMDTKPDFVFHLAAQAIVSESYRNPVDTITTNVVGTTNILKALSKIDFNCVVVLITSDKVYENVEWNWGYRENDVLGGKDIYSGSKAAAELIIKSFWNSFLKDKTNVRIGIGRAGNVIGGGDWSNDRIVVDCVRSFAHKRKINLRAPYSTRPWQHVLEPISGYLALAQSLAQNNAYDGESFNFGPKQEVSQTVLQLTQDLCLKWGLDHSKMIDYKSDIKFDEAKLLKLNCDKAYSQLNWQAALDYDKTINLISDWYINYYSNNKEMYQFTVNQILFYIEEARSQNLNWSK
jgi:CDP-glucose 4,6-dehydratase